MKKAVIALPRDDMPAGVIAQSLAPETARTIPRTNVEIREGPETMCIEIAADDINALRAAVNSYLRWITVSMETYFETRD
jgi:tRNA threonylcarbamoyladenosine modification (KEOPS) complex  Pcc1 subunit